MKRSKCYNILTQLLSDLDDLPGFDKAELREYQAAINRLDDLARRKRRYRVYYLQPYHHRDLKCAIGLFSTLTWAKKYALKMLEEDLTPVSKESDDSESIVIEDIETGEIIEEWVNQCGGEIEHYSSDGCSAVTTKNEKKTAEVV